MRVSIPNNLMLNKTVMLKQNRLCKEVLTRDVLDQEYQPECQAEIRRVSGNRKV